MKILSKLKLGLALAVSLAVPAKAQIDGPPDAIDYQGRVLDALGEPVANGTVENIEMYFRIWDDISSTQGGNLVWAEKQIVTVSDGDFSVRLGEGDLIESAAGDNVVVSGNDDPRPPLLTVFDGKERYLGVSVAPNSVTKPTSEIQPRLAFLTSPFAAVAEKARYAEFGPSNGIFEADLIGVGTSLPGSLIEVVGVASLSPTSGSGLISAGAIGGNHVAFDDNDIQSYSDASTPGVLNLNDHGGNVSIGSPGALTSIESTLTVFGQQGGAFNVLDQPTAGGERLVASLTSFFSGPQLRFEGVGNPIDIGQNSAGAFVVETNDTERFVVTSAGRIGIGTSTPSDTLTIGNTGNLVLSGGDVIVRADQADGLRWSNAAGTTFARLYRNGGNGYVYVFNSNGGLGSGPYLPPGNPNWVSASDERLKSDIQPITGILEKIEPIRVAAYNMAGMACDPDTGELTYDQNRPPRKMRDGRLIKHEIGSIAQDWIENFPELVTEPTGASDHYGLAYDRIGVIALGAAQELNHKLEAAEVEMRKRDETIAALEARLAKLEALLARPKPSAGAK